MVAVAVARWWKASATKANSMRSGQRRVVLRRRCKRIRSASLPVGVYYGHVPWTEVKIVMAANMHRELIALREAMPGLGAIIELGS
jgi:hypothetical protein